MRDLSAAIDWVAFRPAALAVVVLSLLAGCGQKGDLYLPEAEQIRAAEQQSIKEQQPVVEEQPPALETPDTDRDPVTVDRPPL